MDEGASGGGWWAAGGEGLFPCGLAGWEGGVEGGAFLFSGGDGGVEALEFSGLFRGGDLEEWLGVAVADPVLAVFGDVVEEGVDLVEVLLGDGVVFVVVALGAGDGHTEPCDAGGGDAVDDVEVEVFLFDETALVAGHDIAVESGGDFLVDGAVGDEVTGELFGGELIEGHAGVEGLDDPFAPEPHVAEGVVVIAAGVAVACEVEPWDGHAFAEVGGSEETVDGCGEGGGAVFGGIGDEGVDFGDAWG